MAVRRAAAFLGIFCLGLAACTTGTAPSAEPSEPANPPSFSAQSTESPQQPVPTSATLDRGRSTIKLPLDGYAMGQREQNVTLAAQKIVFARCFTDSSKVPDSTMRIVKELLAQKDEPDWEFGYWNADHIKENGFLSMLGSGQFTDELEWTDAARTEKCHALDEYLALEPIAVNREQSTGVLKVFYDAGRKARAKALIDPRFKALVRQRVQCLDQRGITADGSSEVGGASLPEDLTSKAALEVVIADAKCGDELNLVQQAADLVAFYQNRYITDNRNQFIEVKQIADQRFHRAEDVLKEAGIS